MLKLDLNPLWTVVDVLILYVLLRKFLFKPIQNVLDQRQKTIEADIAAAQTSKTEAAAALTTAQDKLRNVDNEAAARREAYEKQAEWRSSSCWPTRRSRLMRSWLPVRLLWRSSARTSCGKQMHRLRHWHAPCAKSF